MKKSNKIKPLAELNLLDRFLFNVVMEDRECCQDVLEIVLGDQIRLLDSVQTEKEFRRMPVTRGIRMDVVAMDEDLNIYNTEMQGKNTGNLLKRERFYQGQLDASLLKPGETDFNKLNDTFMIMIMPFDLFGRGRYCYTCKNHCIEEPDVAVDDGAMKIFLNTRGTNPEGVSQELMDFLCYVEKSTEENCIRAKSERIWRIHNRVKSIKSRDDMGVRYMQDWEEKHYIREEGKAEGKAEGVLLAKQIIRLSEAGKSVPEIAHECEVEEEMVLAVLEG